VLVIGSLTLSACGDDGGTVPKDGSPPGQDSVIADSRPPDSKPPPPGFTLDITIDLDSKLKCSATDPKQDCKGLLVWGIWKKPATDPNPGNPIYLGLLPGATKGTTFKATKLPGASTMYLNLFIDDNYNVKPDAPLPDQGDLVHVDTDPFTAVPDQTITRKITFWARMP